MQRFSFLTLAAGTLAPAAALACSAITMVLNGHVLVAGNNDTSYTQEMKLLVSPNRDGLFGRICIGMETVPGWTPAGMKCMNDQGLAITHAVVPASRTPYDPDRPHFRHNFVEKIVSECATVKQAVAMVRAYTLPQEHNAHVHLMIADTSGDSAVVEWTDDQVKVIPRRGPVQFMTNFLLAKPETATGPKSRYARGSRMLSEVKEASVESLLPVLKEISVYGRVRGQEVGTADSTIWDLKARKLYLYYRRDFDHPLVFDLDQELAKGPRVADLKTLFPDPKPFESGWRDENGPVERKPASN